MSIIKTLRKSQCMKRTAAESLQSCPTLCDPIDSSPPGCLVPGILQARILEWVAISFSNEENRGYKWIPRSMYISITVYICIHNIYLYFKLEIIIDLNKNWRRQWQPTPVLLPGKFHGQRSLVGYSPWGCRESDITEWLHFHFFNKNNTS